MKHRKTYGRRVKPRHKNGYWRIPGIALSLFLLVAVLSRTGFNTKIEGFIKKAAQNESLSEALLSIALSEKMSEAPAKGDAPAPPEETEPVTVLLPSEALTMESKIPLAGSEPAKPLEEVGSLSMTTGGNQKADGIYMTNDTKYSIDIGGLLKKKASIPLSGSGPQVLIMHTHGTEAYTPDTKNNYKATDTDRTTDNRYNMIRVGNEITQILEDSGIETIHSTLLHDYPAYSGCYNRALDAIEKICKDNPSIKVVVDVHRDAIISTTGEKYKAVATINGKQAAQLMFVAGTDAGGLSHPNWQTNLAFQLRLHQKLNNLYPGIMRPIHVRTGRFNQHVTSGSMLLEVGTSGNSLDEALYSAKLFAQALADLLLNNS